MDDLITRTPSWTVQQPSERDRLNGGPLLIVTLSGDTPDDIQQSFARMSEIMGWSLCTAPRS